MRCGVTSTRSSCTRLKLLALGHSLSLGLLRREPALLPVWPFLDDFRVADYPSRIGGLEGPTTSFLARDGGANPGPPLCQEPFTGK
jgi:hypothetical protein